MFEKNKYQGGGVTLRGNPYPFVFGLVLVTMKVLYGLDGSRADGMPVSSWTAWARDIVQSKQRENRTWLSTSAILMPTEDLGTYFDFLKDHVITDEIHEVMRPACRVMSGLASLETWKTRAFPGNSDFQDTRSEPGSPKPFEREREWVRYTLYGEGSRLLHMDYQAVVLAMSACFWIKPSFIHHAAIRLERMIAETGNDT